MSAPTEIKPVEIVLTPEEMRVAMLYRSMDDRRRWEMLHIAEVQAARHQRRASPMFHLIAGGAA